MILTLVAVVAVAAAGYFAVKHYGSAAVLAALKAEIAKLEAGAQAEGLSILARLKALL